MITGECAGTFFRVEDLRPRFAGHRHAAVLPAAAGGSGRVICLDKDGKFFTIKVFVRAPYDQYVTANTRFWQASGIDVSLSASGLSVQTQSLLSILIGGIAFETPPSSAVLPIAETNTLFPLFNNRTAGLQTGRS